MNNEHKEAEWSKEIQKIASEVESEYKMGGLSDGLYFDFAKEVAMRFASSQRTKDLEAIRGAITNEWAGGHPVARDIISLVESVMSNTNSK